MPRRREKLLTIQQAARLTGLSEKALRRRVERGTIGAVTQGTRRLIAATELERAGLLSPGQTGAPATPPTNDEALARLEVSVVALGRRMDALEVWVLRSLNQPSSSRSD